MWPNKKKVTKHDYILHDVTCEQVSKTKYLGITLQDNLSWEKYINTICTKTNKQFKSTPGLPTNSTIESYTYVMIIHFEKWFCKMLMWVRKAQQLMSYIHNLWYALALQIFIKGMVKCWLTKYCMVIHQSLRSATCAQQIHF